MSEKKRGEPNYIQEHSRTARMMALGGRFRHILVVWVGGDSEEGILPLYGRSRLPGVVCEKPPKRRCLVADTA